MRKPLLFAESYGCRGLLERFPGGVINLHPSRLPAYRGPDPLFWQFRDGLRAKEHTVPGTSIIGLQWGDEAKGKLVD